MSAAQATLTRLSAVSHNPFPVVEIFGPTVQGEGPEAGLPAYFVRFGGCDFRCTWCDSMHAVEPAQVREHAERLTTDEITERLRALPSGPGLVVLSGGNPALLELAPLVVALQNEGKHVAVETQGSRWRDWLADVDRLVISPKPPSSGMVTARHTSLYRAFMEATLRQAPPGVAVLKIVIFDGADLEWAAGLHREHPALPLFLSAGTDVGLAEDETLGRLRTRFRWLCEAVARRPEFADTRVTPQLHVVAWGTAMGV